MVAGARLANPRDVERGSPVRPSLTPKAYVGSQVSEEKDEAALERNWSGGIVVKAECLLKGRSHGADSEDLVNRGRCYRLPLTGVSCHSQA